MTSDDSTLQCLYAGGNGRSVFMQAEMDDYMNGVSDKQLLVEAEERTGPLPGR